MGTQRRTPRARLAPHSPLSLCRWSCCGQPLPVVHICVSWVNVHFVCVCVCMYLCDAPLPMLLNLGSFLPAPLCESRVQPLGPHLRLHRCSYPALRYHLCVCVSVWACVLIWPYKSGPSHYLSLSLSVSHLSPALDISMVTRTSGGMGKRSWHVSREQEDGTVWEQRSAKWCFV